MGSSGLTEAETVLQCPGCERWQLHYTASSVEDLVEWKLGRDGRLHMSMARVDALIEHLLNEHVAKYCPRPDIVHELWKAAGRPLSGRR